MQEIDDLKAFKRWIHSKNLSPAAIQSLDLRPFEKEIRSKQFTACLFLGCDLSPAVAGYIVQTGGLVIPNNDKALFKVHRSKLYSPDELFQGFAEEDPYGFEKTLDYQIYQQYLAQGKHQAESILVSLLRRLHDHSITDALEEAVEGKKVVAVMGGHSMERNDEFYLKVAKLSRHLTQQNFLMVSGGGPGAMEATHLGAYFAARPEADLLAAVDLIKVRPPNAEAGKEYMDRDWLHRAWRVKNEFPIPVGQQTGCMSIGIPTWLYGHEPPTLFATHIAKYFANSVREEGLLAIAKHGVIFAPGEAGTTQEIFQDATQNHYGTMDYYSPMILFGKKHWTEKRPLWDFLQHVSQGKIYGQLLALTDDEEEIIYRIQSYDPEAYRV